MHRSIAMLIVALLTFSTEIATAQNFDPSANGRKIVMHLDVKLENKERKRLKEFQSKSPFYGAIAIDVATRGKKGSGATWGYHSLETAQDHALKYCRSKATHKGANCVLLASLIPATGTKGNISPVGRRAIESYKKMSERMAIKQREWGALAVSNYHINAWVIRPSRQQAEADVLAVCQEFVAKNKAKNGTKWRNAGIDPNGEKCRLVQVFPPLRK